MFNPCSIRGSIPVFVFRGNRSYRTILALDRGAQDAPAPEGVELATGPLENLEGFELGAEGREHFPERPDLVVVAVESDVERGPGVGVLERAGLGVGLVPGVDMPVEVDVGVGDRAVVLSVPGDHGIM